MDLTITLICEYLSAEDECIAYLTSININENKYEYIYGMFPYENISTLRKVVRHISHVTTSDLSKYPNLMTVCFDDKYNSPISKLPENLVYLRFESSFHSTTKLILPCKLQELIWKCNCDVPDLPSSLIGLTIEYKFDHKLPMLPNKLKRLEWNCNRNLPILPASLIKLQIGSLFNREIRRKLPDSINTIIWWSSHKLPMFPKNLITLQVWSNIQLFTITTWPIKMRYIHFINNYNQYIPIFASLSELRSLIIGDQYNRPLQKLPEQLLILSIGRAFNQKIQSFPHKLIRLVISSSKYDFKLPTFPNNLRELSLGHRNTIKFLDGIINTTYNCVITKVPNTLIYLCIDHPFESKLQTLPSNLIHLEWFCNQELPTLPDTLKQLNLGSYHNHQIPNMPPRLNILSLGKYFCYKPPMLPNTIEEIYVHKQYIYLEELQSLYHDKVCALFWL